MSQGNGYKKAVLMSLYIKARRPGTFNQFVKSDQCKEMLKERRDRQNGIKTTEDSDKSNADVVAKSNPKKARENTVKS